MRVTDEMVKAFYDSPAWRATRRAKLAKDGLCKACMMDGRDEVATMVHHLINIRTRMGWERKLDMKMLMSLCNSCHSIIEAEVREQGRGA